MCRINGAIAIKRLRIHKAAIFLAILVGVIVAFPQIYFRYDNRQIYQGIDMISSHEETFYLSRIQEAREGRFNLSGSLFKEGKHDPYLQPPLGEILIAYLGKILFLDLKNTILLARFIFPFLTFLVVYAFVFLISKEKLIALAASTAIFSLDTFFINREAFFSLFKVLQGGIPFIPIDFLQFWRPVHPMVSSFFFFAFLLSFWLFYKREEWRFGVLSALIIGLSFYIYSYLWTFLLSFWIIFLLILIFQKKWHLLKKMIIMLFLGSLIGLPLFFNYYLFLSHPYSSDLFERLVLNKTPRELHLPFSGIFLLIIFLIFFPRKWKERYYFLLTSLLAPFFLYNQHLITGRSIQVAHYWRYYRLPLAIMILIILFFSLFSLKENLKRFKKAISIFVIGISILIGIVFQTGAYFFHKSENLTFQRYGPILEYLNRNAQKEEVVFSDSNLSSFVPVYTSLNVFSHPVPDYPVISKERLTETLFLYYRLEGLREKDTFETFSQDREKVSQKVFGGAVISDEVLYSFAERYGDFIQIPLDKVLEKYGINYVIWDTANYPSWSLEKYQFLEKVYKDKEFEIFKVL